MAAKKITALIKLQVKAGEAKPAPPLGPALGQRGLNIMDFCKKFNAETASIEKGTPIPVVITAYSDKSFTFITKTPPVSFFLKKELSISSGSKLPGRDFVGSINAESLERIAKQKMEDMGVDDLNSAVSMVMGSAISMGIKINT
ncbi:MAG: 50S ribosomal protein L11 [Proteobacteria bacterium]|nr:50S ribosomal protein L11 [Pseudomonadota bacterium]